MSSSIKSYKRTWVNGTGIFCAMPHDDTHSNITNKYFFTFRFSVLMTSCSLEHDGIEYLPEIDKVGCECTSLLAHG